MIDRDRINGIIHQKYLEMRVSKYITMAEAIKSQTAERYGLRNVPNDVQLENMKYVAANVFDPVREWVGGPVYVSSFFRAAAVNVKAGGSATSDHPNGFAIDIDADVYALRQAQGDRKSNKDIFDYIRAELEYDQLIWEYGSNVNPAWVHVSLRKVVNRKQALRVYREEGRAVYVPFDLY